MSASDVIFIQERNALNSVNIPLAFLFPQDSRRTKYRQYRRTIKNTGNPTFNPNHKADIIRALKMAWQLSTWGKGEMNYTYALENMSIDKVGKQYAEVYRRFEQQIVMLLPVSIIYQNTKCMKYNEIKVSVVIPVYNTEKYVRQAVESVMYQSLKELEIIVVDDGSTDKSLSIVEKLGDTDKRIQIYTQANQGQSIARNRGISHAHGEYIYFMDSDDLLEEDALELCYHKCKEEKLDFVFFDALVFF